MEKTVRHLGRATPPAAKPISSREILGKLPLAEGAIAVGEVSPREESKLREMGWTGQSSVPGNLEEIAQQVRRELMASHDQDALADTLAAVEKLGGKKLQVEEVDVRDLPPDKQEAYQRIIAEVITQTEEQARQEQEDAINPALSKSVAAAIQAADSSPTVADDTQASTYASGAVKERRNEPAAAETTGLCSRCGFPKNQTDDLEIDDSTIQSYAISLFSLKPYVKTESLIGGRVSVTLRTLSAKENDAVAQQLYQDIQSKRIENRPEEIEFSARYRLALQLVSVETPEQQLAFPKSFAEWQLSEDEDEKAKQAGRLGVISDRVMDQIGANESLYRTLTTLLYRFNAEVLKLERLARDPNFYKAISG